MKPLLKVRNLMAALVVAAAVLAVPLSAQARPTVDPNLHIHIHIEIDS